MEKALARLLLVIFVSGLCAEALAQAPPSPDAYLLSKGIINTPANLREALKNSDPGVRGVAAGLIAESADTGAVPLIQHALSKETNDQARLNFSNALIKLQAVKGAASLVRICENDRETSTTRISAALRLQEAGNEVCTISVVRILAESVDPPGRELGLQYLSRLTTAPSTITPNIRTIAVRELKDPAPINRVHAAEVISMFGDKTSVGPLQQAANSENDPKTKDHINDDLQRLQYRLRVSP